MKWCYVTSQTKRDAKDNEPECNDMNMPPTEEIELCHGPQPKLFEVDVIDSK